MTVDEQHKEYILGLIQAHAASYHPGPQSLRLEARQWEQTLSFSDEEAVTHRRGLHLTARVIHPEQIILANGRALNEYDFLIELLSNANIEHPTGWIGQLKLLNPDDDGFVLGHAFMPECVFEDIWERVRLMSSPMSSLLSLSVIGLGKLGSGQLWDFEKTPVLVITEASVTFKYGSLS